MTPIFHQIDEDVFPNPHAFLPERWINISEQERIRMEHYFNPYSKGARQCAGIKSVTHPCRSLPLPYTRRLVTSPTSLKGIHTHTYSLTHLLYSSANYVPAPERAPG